jgi:hypothetical protein
MSAGASITLKISGDALDLLKPFVRNLVGGG